MSVTPLSLLRILTFLKRALASEQSADSLMIPFHSYRIISTTILLFFPQSAGHQSLGRGGGGAGAH